uniref:vigilin-like n=1 Tax=Jaculus jaculus TaxID=51337 RepID=UPI001E1B0403|nr:vigilin-like [Jaculus jaculus]
MDSRNKHNVHQKKCFPKKSHSNILTSKHVVGKATARDKVTKHLEEKKLLKGPQEIVEPSSNNIQQAKISVSTQAFYLPQEEEYHLFQFGEGTLDNFYAYIMKKTGANLEFAFLENQGLYVTVFGNPDTVRKAHKEIFEWCRKQDLSMSLIPKEERWSFMGLAGDTAQDLEQNTAKKNKNKCSHKKKACVDIADKKHIKKKNSDGHFATSAKKHKGVIQRLDMEKAFSSMTSMPHSNVSDNVFQETEVHLLIPLSNISEMGIEFIGGKHKVDPSDFCIKEAFDMPQMQTEPRDVVKKWPHEFSPSVKKSFLYLALAEFEDSIETSPSGGTSNLETHDGEPSSSGKVFNEAVWNPQDSVISSIYAPSWLHKHIISSKHQYIDKITENVPKVHIHFTDEDNIILEGPLEDVNYAQEQFQLIVHDLMRRMDYAEINSDCKFHKYLIENNNENINRISEKHQVSITISPEAEKNTLIRIEGESIEVQKAKKELLELAANSSPEHIQFMFIKHYLHNLIFGRKRERLHEIYKKFPDVIIHFPQSKEKSDVVQLVGPKPESDKCIQYLEKMLKDIKENNYSINVPILKRLHKRLIGKRGSNIKLISQISNTTIRFPSESSSSEDFVITGYPENCDIAHEWILSIQKDIDDTTEEEIHIPSSLHKLLTNSKMSLITQIVDECGKFDIHFPRSKTDIQKVVIKGSIETVEKAKQKILYLAEEEKAKSYSMSVHVKSQYHQFLLNKNGSNVPIVCEKTGVRIVLPTTTNEDQELVKIIGREEAVKNVKKELDILLKDLENVEEDSVVINRKFHHYFVMRKNQLLQEMNEEYGGLAIAFSYAGKHSAKVTIKGAKPCVQAAKSHIQDLFKPFASKVTLQCVIPQKFHSFITGSICSRIYQITRDYKVQIKFPEREKTAVKIGLGIKGKEKENWQNNSKGLISNFPSNCDIVYISGHMDNCKAAKKALESLIPVTDEIHVPSNLRTHIMGPKGDGLLKLRKVFGVHIQWSKPEINWDVISIMGLAANVEQAKIKLQQRVKDLQMEMEDRELKSFKLAFTLDPKQYYKITSYKGLLLAKICTEHGVTISFPRKASHHIQDEIIITGYKEKTLAARDAIIRVLHEIEKRVSKQISLNHHVRHKITGFHRKAIQKIMNQFQVDIYLPPIGYYNPNITVTGLPDNVSKAIDYITNLQKNYMSTSTENGSQRGHSKSASTGNIAIVPSKSSVKK